MGYWSIIGVMSWAFFGGLVVLYFAVAYGLAGAAGWLALNLAVAYWLNQARKHSRAEEYDDHLPEERVRIAREDLITYWEKRKEKKE